MNAAVKEYWNSGLAHINTLPLLFLKQKIKLRFSPKVPEEFLLCHFCDLELDLHGSEGWKEQFCCGGLNYCNKWTKIMTLQLDSFRHDFQHYLGEHEQMVNVTIIEPGTKFNLEHGGVNTFISVWSEICWGSRASQVSDRVAHQLWVFTMSSRVSGIVPFLPLQYFNSAGSVHKPENDTKVTTSRKATS